MTTAPLRRADGRSARHPPGRPAGAARAGPRHPRPPRAPHGSGRRGPRQPRSGRVPRAVLGGAAGHRGDRSTRDGTRHGTRHDGSRDDEAARGGHDRAGDPTTTAPPPEETVSAVQAVRDYYALMDAGRIEEGFARLSPAYRERTGEGSYRGSGRPSTAWRCSTRDRMISSSTPPCATRARTAPRPPRRSSSASSATRARERSSSTTIAFAEVAGHPAPVKTWPSPSAFRPRRRSAFARDGGGEPRNIPWSG